jgi:RHS repeat-associated protein
MFVTTINSDYSRTLSSKGYYAAGTLDITISKDENWKSGRGGTTETYKDVLGHVILKRTYNYTGGQLQQLSTYYVYDDLDNLTFVLTPGSLPDNGAPVQTTLDTWCYQYRYDTRNRVVQKKIPGKGWDYLIYNALDQVVATQDAIQRNQSSQQWTFTKYDAQGRVILSGIALYGVTAGINDQAALQTAVNAYTTYWETPTTTTGNGYTATAWPTGWSTNLIANYYDDYSFTTGKPAAFTAPTGSSVMTKGLLTATKAYVLGTSDPLWTVNYYDDLGRVIQVDKQHYLGGALSPYNYDIVTNGYDFANELTSTNRLHYAKNAGGTAAVQGATIATGYIYDQEGRKIQTSEAIALGSNALPAPILLSQESYNEIGQLMAKKLHSTDGGSTFLQNTAYLYNERGWLSQINDPSVASSATKLFSEKLNYNVTAYGASAQYNGNIAETDYNASLSGRRHVVYGYDPLNRLTNGTSSAGFSETGITYDSMGNIMTLKRGTNATTTYGYTGNQLTTLTGYINGTNVYDVNGNLYTDGTRGNAAIRYNMLNLPQTVTTTGVSITYTYDADGTKLRKVSSAGTTDYIGGIQYKSNSTAIDFIQTEEGRAINSGSSWNYEYTLTDHLGNNRVTFDIVTGKVGEDDYYPFGLNAKWQVNATNNYLYNKKELQSELTEYDYGARFYDPVVARFISVDPISEQMRRFSPYDYALDNPIRFIDKDGMGPNDPNEKITHAHDVLEHFKYDDKSQKKGTDFLTGSKETFTTIHNKDGSTTLKIETVNRTATVDAKGKIGKDVIQTKSTYQETRTTNDKDCPECLVPGSYSDNQKNPEVSTISYKQAATDDPALKADVQDVAGYKSKVGESPIPTIAKAYDEDIGNFGDMMQAGSLLLPDGSLLSKLADAISWDSTVQPPASAEGISIDHDIDKKTKKVW